VRVPASIVVAYVLLGGGWFAYELFAGDRADGTYVAFAAVWTVLAVALLMRQTLAAFLLGAFEMLFLVGAMTTSGDWNRFALQLLLTAMILDPVVTDWVNPGPRQRPLPAYWVVTGVLATALLLWSAVLALTGDPDALKPFAGALLLGFDVLRVLGRTRAAPPGARAPR
jgi:hypothetical protein